MKLRDRYPTLIRVIIWILRIFVGGLFLFSGFTKGIDVWGTLYKFKDYFGALGYGVWDGLNLFGVFSLCIVEFITGFCILFGCFRRGAPIVALAIMVLMLPLTLWLAVANPIADCGCFGDALKLTNWQTFYKNLVLTAAIIWLVVYNARVRWLVSPYLQWIAVVVTGAYIFLIALIGYHYQPLIDFRPYKTGTPLIEDSGEESDMDEDDLLRFVYEKDGERKTFTIDDVLPDEDDGWTFVERYYDTLSNDGDAGLAGGIKTPKAPDAAPEKSIRFYDENGREDVTDYIIGGGRQLIMMIPSIADISAAKTWKINSLYDWCEANGIEMMATVGGNPLEIRRFRDLSLAEYPIYTSDDTAIEEVVRGNPGIIYLEDGIIKWKSALAAINVDDFKNPEVTDNPMNFARDNRHILLTITWIYLLATALLILLSFIPDLFTRIFFRPKPKDHAKPQQPDKENES